MAKTLVMVKPWKSQALREVKMLKRKGWKDVRIHKLAQTSTFGNRYEIYVYDDKVPERRKK